MTWQDVPGFFDFQDLYSEAVHNAPDSGARFVEIGTFFGRSAVYMAEQIAQSQKTIAFDCIDTWDPSFLTQNKTMPPQVRDELQKIADTHGGILGAFFWYVTKCGVGSKIFPVRADQIEAAPMYRDGSLDFVFLDSDHSYNATAAAIKAWLPKVKPGGVFAGHDFTPRWPGVVAAVNDLIPGAVARGTCFYWKVPT